MISCDLDIFAHLFVCLVAYSNITADIPDRMSAVFLLIYVFCMAIKAKNGFLSRSSSFPRVSADLAETSYFTAKANCGGTCFGRVKLRRGGRIICRKGHSTRRGRPEGIWQTMP